ncbi:uncharacterized protein [Solanum lycopersicum]|uniref:uncharacterized protein n=1 Tax=Solanum lycopersicum TaxID=4081 RepID=UPI0037497103
MAQTWYAQWRDNSPLRGRPVTWEVFKKTILDRFFPSEKREAKWWSSSTFIKDYAPSLVHDPRDEMNFFVTGVLDDMQEECHLAMGKDKKSLQASDSNDAPKKNRFYDLRSRREQETSPADHHVSTKSSQRTLARRNIEEQEVPNAPDVQPQGEVTNAKFWEAIRMLSQVVTNQIKEARIKEFLTLKQDTISVHEYGLNFTQLSCYASEMVKGMRRRMSLFVAGLGHASSKESRAAMVIGDMDISRLMNFKARMTQSEGSVAQGGSKAPVCTKSGRYHPVNCRDGQKGCYKCSQEGHFMRECPKNKLGVEIELNLHQLLHQIGLHPGEPLLGKKRERCSARDAGRSCCEKGGGEEIEEEGVGERETGRRTGRGRRRKREGKGEEEGKRGREEMGRLRSIVDAAGRSCVAARWSVEEEEKSEGESRRTSENERRGRWEKREGSLPSLGGGDSRRKEWMEIKGGGLETGERGEEEDEREKRGEEERVEEATGRG